MHAAHAPEAAIGLEGFGDFVGTVIQEWKVLGLAISVVKDGDVIFAQGFGLRDAARGLEVTPQTLFPIASCTKAFTTMAMGLLVDEGKLEWDTPVKTYLPTFRLYDSVAGERITPRDLVTHRSGLPRHDLVWYKSSASRRELVDRLPYLEPSQDFRALWQYQNLLYMVAGYLVEHISGQSWEDFVQHQIFDRLGMATSNFSVRTCQETSDFSLPYKEEKDEVKEIPFYEQWAIGPAGSINSTVDDMSQWVLLHLNKGMHGGTRLVSEGQIAQMHAPHMVMPDPSKYPELTHASYGLGWSVQTYRGHAMVQHSGGIDGFRSLVTLLPHDRAGVVVLSNLGSTLVPEVITFGVCDRLLALDQVPWNERFLKDHAEWKEAAEKGKEKSAEDRVPGTHPSHPLASYTGDFAHPGYGILSVALEGDELRATFNAMTVPLAHYHYDIFEMVWEQFFDMRTKVSFATNVAGDIESLAVPLEPTVKDIVFQRMPGKEMTEKSFLQTFIGEYDLSGMAMTVTFKGDHALLVFLPGQPDYELVPYKGTTFHAKGLSGLSIEFTTDESGTEARVMQPWGLFTAKKK